MRWWGLILPVCLLASCSTPPPVIGERQITGRFGDARSPVLSPDWAAIAFAAVAAGYTNPPNLGGSRGRIGAAEALDQRHSAELRA